MSKKLRETAARLAPVSPDDAYALSTWVNTGYGWSGPHVAIHEALKQAVRDHGERIISQLVMPAADSVRHRYFASMSARGFAATMDDLASDIRRIGSA